MKHQQQLRDILAALNADNATKEKAVKMRKVSTTTTTTTIKTSRYKLLSNEARRALEAHLKY